MILYYWVKIENGLPQQNERVIGFDGERVGEVTYDSQTNKKTHWYWAYVGCPKIKAWMPLPKPPEK